MVAQRIRRVSRESDYVARLGGDEFGAAAAARAVARQRRHAG
jgi:GGDEF domain-containing protein